MLVRSYRTVSPLPPRTVAVCFLWHCPASHLGLPLAITLLCEVRTFLEWYRYHPRPPGQLVRTSILFRCRRPGRRALCRGHHGRRPGGRGGPVAGERLAHDQEVALEYWTEKVGMEVREDVSLPELGDFRWLTVGPPGQDESTRHEVLNLVAKGFAGTVFLTTDNCQATYDKMKVRPATAFASASRSKSLRADHDSPQNGGGSLAARAARRFSSSANSHRWRLRSCSLMARSAAIRSSRSCFRVRLRRGIISPRPSPGSAVSLSITTSPVGVAKIGKNRLPPGLVV